MNTGTQERGRNLRHGALLFAALALASWQSAGAASLSSDALYLLPQETGQVGFVDLKALRASPHYPLLRQRLLASRAGRYDVVLRSLGIDIDKNIDWIAWGRVPAQTQTTGNLLLGIARGRFDANNTAASYRERGLRLDAYRGQTLFPLPGQGDAQRLTLAFLDSSTAVFGSRLGLQHLLDVRFGGHPNLTANQALSALLNQVNGRAPAWVVFDGPSTPAIVRRLFRETTKFAEYGAVVEGFRGSWLRLDMENVVRVGFEAQCATPAAAQSFAQLLQAGLLAQSWRAQTTRPGLSALLGEALVQAGGERVQVEAVLEEGDLATLLGARRR